MRAVNDASELLNEIGWEKPSDFKITEIAEYLGVVVKEAELKGAEGRIIMNDSNAIVTINSQIYNPGKKNFILSHELGHFRLHKNIIKEFSDTDQTLNDWFTKGPHEKEANDFATQLLMPDFYFKSLVKGKKLSLNLIENVAFCFQSSILATFLRYVELGDFPAMVIYMKDNKVLWKRASKDFPFQYLELSSKVPEDTVAGDYFNQGFLENKPELVDAIEWFPNDYKLKYDRTWKLYEQCYKVSDNGLVSCLWSP